MLLTCALKAILLRNNEYPFINMRQISHFIFIWLCLCFCCLKSEDNGIKCELAAFLENLDGTDPQLIDSGSAVNATQLKSCEESDVCASIVKEQVIAGTDGGNLTLIADERNGYTVGDILCDKADAVEENVRNKIVHIYWRICGSSWKSTSFKMPEPLCCEDGLYFPCKVLKSEL